MAAERTRRNNAGSKMNNLLEAEDEDEFYKTTYGGFEEEAEDNDYNSEDSDSESTDTDFSIDENDDVRSDEDDDNEPKRKRRVVTKAYKEPKREGPEEKKVKVEEKTTEKEKTADIPSVQIYMSPERKSLRKSTTIKSKQTQSRQKQREHQAKMLAEIADRNNVKVEDVRRLTQDELLAEAKVTEQINMKSLETYRKLELEKKRARVQKEVYRGPVVRFQSVTMPLLADDACLEPEINVDEDGETPGEAAQPLDTGEKCSRTFITFTDQNMFHSIFPQVKRKAPQKMVCPVTRLPAKYIDPITNTPYATQQAFRLIREVYAKQLAQSAEGKGSTEGGKSSGSLLAVSQQKRKDKGQADTPSKD